VRFSDTKRDSMRTECLISSDILCFGYSQYPEPGFSDARALEKTLDGYSQYPCGVFSKENLPTAALLLGVVDITYIGARVRRRPEPAAELDKCTHDKSSDSPKGPEPEGWAVRYGRDVVRLP